MSVWIQDTLKKLTKLGRCDSSGELCIDFLETVPPSPYSALLFASTYITLSEKVKKIIFGQIGVSDVKEQQKIHFHFWTNWEPQLQQIQHKLWSQILVASTQIQLQDPEGRWLLLTKLTTTRSCMLPTLWSLQRMKVSRRPPLAKKTLGRWSLLRRRWERWRDAPSTSARKKKLRKQRGRRSHWRRRRRWRGAPWTPARPSLGWRLTSVDVKGGSNFSSSFLFHCTLLYNYGDLRWCRWGWRVFN